MHGIISRVLNSGWITLLVSAHSSSGASSISRCWSIEIPLIGNQFSNQF